MSTFANNDLVSIITPLYNKEKFVEATILSVLSQTYTEWEMIIIDDCSTDKSADIVNKYCQMDSRIRYYKNNKNSGVAKSRNRAISLAKGRYIAFLDADDLWKVDKLEKQISFMEKESCTFCYSACEVIDEQDNLIKEKRKVPAVVDYSSLLKGNAIPCLTVVLDRLHFDKIELTRIGHEDYVLWLELLQNGEKAQGLDEVLATYREYKSSLSSNKVMSAKWVWKIYRTHLKVGFFKSCVYFIYYSCNALRKRI